MLKRIFLTFALLSSALNFKASNLDNFYSDLDFIYQTIKENHPGIYNNLDPNFGKNLECFYTEALKEILEQASIVNTQQSINRFLEKFDDPHVYVFWNNVTQDKKTDAAKTFSLSYPQETTAWVSLPTFDPHHNDLQSFYEEISKLKTKKYIIFDLRNNQGGNSEYGSQICNALFGKKYAQYQRDMLYKNVTVDWRASKGNLDHLFNLQSKYPQCKDFFSVIIHGIQESLNSNKHFYTAVNRKKHTIINSVPPLSPITAKIIVITDSVNVSAALDFIDELQVMTTNLVLIGKKTKADRLYMEVRSIPLPSKAGIFNFPIKVYRNRLRQDNEPYIPNVAFEEIDNNQGLEAFILEYISIV